MLERRAVRDLINPTGQPDVWEILILSVSVGPGPRYIRTDIYKIILFQLKIIIVLDGFKLVHITHRLYLSVQFVRVTSSTEPAEIYQILTQQWGLAPPHLVVALMGGDEVAQLKPWLRDTLRKGLVKAAQSTGGLFIVH